MTTCDEEWFILIRVSPFSTGRGRTTDQKDVGPEYKPFQVKAWGFHQAMQMAEAIILGIRSNPMVWTSEIIGVIHADKIKWVEETA